MEDPAVQALLYPNGVPKTGGRDRAGLLNRIPEPWHARVTGRRFRRWRHAARAIARHNARLPADAPVLNFYPMLPQPHAPVSFMLRRLGVRIGHEPRADQPTIAWDGDTWFSPRSARRLPSNAINGRCLDISKTVVDNAWQEVTGRSLAIDPRTASGPIVTKPEDNGRHGGRVIVAPIDRPRRGWVYQRLVDWREGDWVRQTRAVVIGGEIIVAYEKWRPFSGRFFGTILTLPRHAEQIYSSDEQAQVLTFASRMGIEYGELDILRDPADGEIYVVDANRTPSWPHELPADYTEDAFGPMTEAFRALIGV